MKELPFKVGMIFKSKTHPQFDLVIEYVCYNIDDETEKIIPYATLIDWSNINIELFDKFCETHCRSKDSTFPYPSWGECNLKSMKARLKKYNLEYAGMSDREVTVYTDSGFEYSAGFKR